MSKLSRRGQHLVDSPRLPVYIAEHFARAGQPWDRELRPQGYAGLCIAENKLHSDALISQLARLGHRRKSRHDPVWRRHQRGPRSRA